MPHFEKMLYDNAQLLDLLTLVWQETQDPLYAARMPRPRLGAARDDAPRAAASPRAYDADSEGVEGKFYVWNAAEIDAVLGPEDARVLQARLRRHAGRQLGRPQHPQPQPAPRRC